MGLSVCVVLRNEEFFLPGLLRECRKYADEIVLVDTGSTDNSATIGSAAGAQVVHFPTTDLSAARNVGMSCCSSEWILFLDADERFMYSDFQKLRLGEPGRGDAGKNVAFIQPIFNYVGSGAWANFYTLRLIRNGTELTWSGQFHESIMDAVMDSGLPYSHSPAPIRHMEFVGPTPLREKRKRNIGRIQPIITPGNPAHAKLLALNALDYYALGHRETAIQMVRTACHDTPTSHLAWRFLGQFLSAAGDTSELGAGSEAANAFAMSLANLPAGCRRRSIPMFGCLQNQVRIGEYAAAATLARQIIELEPASHSWLNLATIAFLMGDEALVGECFAEACDSDQHFLDPAVHRTGQAGSVYHVQRSVLREYHLLRSHPLFGRRVAGPLSDTVPAVVAAHDAHFR